MIGALLKMRSSFHCSLGHSLWGDRGPGGSFRPIIRGDLPCVSILKAEWPVVSVPEENHCWRTVTSTRWQTLNKRGWMFSFCLEWRTSILVGFIVDCSVGWVEPLLRIGRCLNSTSSLMKVNSYKFDLTKFALSIAQYLVFPFVCQIHSLFLVGWVKGFRGHVGTSRRFILLTNTQQLWVNRFALRAADVLIADSSRHVNYNAAVVEIHWKVDWFKMHRPLWTPPSESPPVAAFHFGLRINQRKRQLDNTIPSLLRIYNHLFTKKHNYSVFLTNYLPYRGSHR